ncbi:glutathione S-transferase family protein [Lentibacter algarum]|uniref:glutathione S-transferase family protein n=1 Tax=Lentibacter algarum TaxID=576131 RepID=UPI001C070E0F|nr:glutathione S-transferase family protein [Lentibacter algarum]MBU2981157.1 glutathione S-transferase family protein [Lentibacter algarum]
MTYEVFGGVASRAFRVLWVLDELGVEFVHHDVGPHSPEAYEMNPSGKIPSFKDGDDTITDSAAIVTYLADKHGQFTYPAGSIERARQDALTHQILDELDAVLWAASRHSFVLPEEQRVPEVKPSLRWEFARNVKLMEDKLQGPFLMGEKMTIPDFLLVHCLNWAASAKFDYDSDKIDAYVKRLRARDGFKKTRGRLKT